MSKEKSSTGNGIGFGSLLLLLFIALKLTGYIAWSWWWVMSPLWAPVSVFLLAAIGAAIQAAKKQAKE